MNLAELIVPMISFNFPVNIPKPLFGAKDCMCPWKIYFKLIKAPLCIS